MCIRDSSRSSVETPRVFAASDIVASFTAGIVFDVVALHAVRQLAVITAAMILHIFDVFFTFAPYVVVSKLSVDVV